MLDRDAARAAIESAIELDSYVPPNTDRQAAEAHVYAHLCDPYELTAEVMEPGLPFAEAGESVSGYCVAHDAGYWLVYQPHERRFLCFWGTSPEILGVWGVFGNPLYCWTA